MAATKKRVLVVDDALDIARLLRSALGAADPGLVITVFPSAEEAIFASAREPVHLLISDIRLPGISGTDLVKRIRARNPGVKVILISGLPGSKTSGPVGELNVDGFFQKPFEVSDFVALAQRCLAEAVEVALPDVELQPAPSQPEWLPATNQKLDEMLVELRQSVHATAAWMIGADGAVFTSVGSLPQGAAAWGPAVARAVFCQAELAGLLEGDSSQSFMTVRGKAVDLVLSFVNQHTCVLAFQPGVSPLRLALAYEETRRWLPEIGRALQSGADRTAPVESRAEISITAEEAPPATAAQAPASPEPEIGAEELLDLDAARAAEPELDDLAAILEAAGGQLGVADVDEFWEALAGSSQPAAHSPETISFEEAVRLGIAPGE